MSRTRHHDDSWRVWGEYRKQRDLRKDHENWKQEALEELNMADKTEVYVIINEWDGGAEGEQSEIVGGLYFDSEDTAWYHLSEIADEYGIAIEHEDTSFDAPVAGGIEHETYYIQELVLWEDS